MLRVSLASLKSGTNGSLLPLAMSAFSQNTIDGFSRAKSTSLRLTASLSPNQILNLSLMVLPYQPMNLKLHLKQKLERAQGALRGTHVVRFITESTFNFNFSKALISGI